MTRELNSPVLKHIEHLDDMVMYSPELTIKHLQDVKKGTLEYSLKWDGSPSIVFGKMNGIAFVSTKSFFNKTPVLYSANDEILRAGLSTELSIIMMVTLNYAQYLNVKNIAYQGDVMFCPGNLKVHETYVEFGLNLIKYSVLKKSPEFDSIKDALVGIAVHTRYEIHHSFDGFSCKKQIFKHAPKSTTDVYIFEHITDTLYNPTGWSDDEGEPGIVDDLIEHAQELMDYQQSTQYNLTKYHEMFRKFKTKCLMDENSPVVYDPEGFAKLCFETVSTKLFEDSTHKVRSNCIQKLTELNDMLEDTGDYFLNLCRFTSKAQELVKLNIRTIDTSIIAQHEGLVVSTSEYMVKYVDKNNFTYLNNLKRNTE